MGEEEGKKGYFVLCYEAFTKFVVVVEEVSNTDPALENLAFNSFFDVLVDAEQGSHRGGCKF